MLAHQRAPEFQRVGACRVRNLVHEAFHVHRVLVGVDAPPRTHRHVRVAHRVLELERRERVAELRVAGFFVVALHLALVLAVGHRDGLRKALIDCPDTRRCTPTSLPLRRDRPAARLRNRPEEVVRHVFFAVQTSLTGTPGNCLAIAVAWRT